MCVSITVLYHMCLALQSLVRRAFNHLVAKKERYFKNKLLSGRRRAVDCVLVESKSLEESVKRVRRRKQQNKKMRLWLMADGSDNRREATYCVARLAVYSRQSTVGIHTQHGQFHVRRRTSVGSSAVVCSLCNKCSINLLHLFDYGAFARLTGPYKVCEEGKKEKDTNENGNQKEGEEGR